MVITGEHLDAVTWVGAFRASDAGLFECIFEPADQSATSITCTFDTDVSIPISVDENDTYSIEVYSDGCGHAAERPTFVVVDDPD